MTKCSRNLTKHIQLLRAERNRITVLQKNGYTVPTEDVTDYLHHLRYVKALIRNEKMKHFNKIFLHSINSLTN